MAAGDSLSRQFHEGFIHPSLLIPTEGETHTKEIARPAGSEYQNNLTSDIAKHGIHTPLEAYYSERGPHGIGRKQKPKLYLYGGHHRLHAAKQLGLDKVPVRIESSKGYKPDDQPLGRPPELQ